MEKTYQLDQKEQQQLAQVEQERTQALAMIGALSLDMEQARKNLDVAAERQRSFLRQALANRGVERYDQARAQSGVVYVTLPDMPAPVAQEGPRIIERPNGQASELAKE